MENNLFKNIKIEVFIICTKTQIDFFVISFFTESRISIKNHDSQED